MKERDLKQEISDDLGEFGERGGLKAFNPGNYLLQMMEKGEGDYSFDGLRNDLESVVAETLMEAELRKVSFEAEINESGNLVWNAPGHDGGERGDVLEMADKTVDRFIKMSKDKKVSEAERGKYKTMARRFFLEREQTEMIIKMLSEQNEEKMVLAILPDNDVVYPLTQVNYLTTYQLKVEAERGMTIEANPFMNRYSNRVLSSLLGKESAQEAELILGVQEVREFEKPDDLFLEVEALVNDEERGLQQVGSIIDRTRDVESCREVIDFGRSYLEEILKIEFDNLTQGIEWKQVRSRLDTAWELVVKNIVGFLSGGKNYLTENELLDMQSKYRNEILLGFSRARFLSEIISEKNMQVLGQPLVVAGACGSLGFGGLGGVPVGANAAEWKPGCCVNPGCAHGGGEVMVGPCGICAECEKVL